MFQNISQRSSCLECRLIHFYWTLSSFYKQRSLPACTESRGSTSVCGLHFFLSPNGIPQSQTVAAVFVQQLMTTYENRYNSLKGAEVARDKRADEIASKECSNLITLLSELYNFQVVSCVLIYDVIRNFLEENLSEITVELLLKLARSKSAPSDTCQVTNVRIMFQIPAYNYVKTTRWH
jgi:hypothetical protein